jgi:hypothetical protein
MKQMGLSLSQKFSKESADAMAGMKVTSTAYAFDDVRVYFLQLKKRRHGQSERPAMLHPNTMR